MRGFPGYQSHCILRDDDERGHILVISEWTSREAAERIRAGYWTAEPVRLITRLLAEPRNRWVLTKEASPLRWAVKVLTEKPLNRVLVGQRHLPMCEFQRRVTVRGRRRALYALGQLRAHDAMPGGGVEGIESGVMRLRGRGSRRPGTRTRPAADIPYVGSSR